MTAQIVRQSASELLFKSVRAVLASPRRLVSPEDDAALSGDFYLHQHNIPHLLPHKSPCSAHIKAPLAFGSISLFVVYQMKINQPFLDCIELWRQWTSLCLPSLN